MKNNFNLKIFEIEILIPQDDLEITIADISCLIINSGDQIEKIALKA